MPATKSTPLSKNKFCQVTIAAILSAFIERCQKILSLLQLTPRETQVKENLELDELDQISRPEEDRAAIDLCIDWYATEVQELKQRLQEQNVLSKQIEERTQLIVHDLKNPLLGANRVLDFLITERSGPLTEQQRTLLETTRASNTELLSLLLNLTETLQSKGKLNLLTYELIDMQVLLNEFVGLLSPFLGLRKIGIVLEVSDNISIMADRLLISRLIYNLLDNASKYSPDGTTISIRFWSKNEWLYLQIVDQGPGIAEHELKNVFDKYWRAPDLDCSTRTGLGLYFCRQIVETHGGNIWCTSVQGEGCKFDVVLPVGTCTAL
jgi:signal transduction histidine kinase